MSTGVRHMTCRELVELLTDYLEDALDPELRADLERHVVFCGGCASYVEQMRSTIGLLARLAEADEPDPSAVDSDALLAAFRAWRAGRRP